MLPANLKKLETQLSIFHYINVTRNSKNYIVLLEINLRYDIMCLSVLK